MFSGYFFVLHVVVFFSFFTLQPDASLYVYKDAQGISSGLAIPSLFIIAFMIVMIIAPVIIHILEKGGNELLARIMAYSGYIWMAIIFIFFTFHLLFDFLEIVCRPGGWVLKKRFLICCPCP